jgi:hypothetical protein
MQKYYNNTVLKLDIKKSQILLAGFGVFANEFIPKNTICGTYDGKCIIGGYKMKHSNYLIFISKKLSIDAQEYPRCYMAMINDAYNSDFVNNCIFIYKKKKVIIMTTQDINIGDELFVSYGSSYWN